VSTTPWPAGLAAGDPAVARFGFVVTFACPGSYSFPCQHPASAGMADTFAVS
jgi:plastocyanin